MASGTIKKPIAEEILERFPEPIKFVSQMGGTFAGIVGNRQLWLFGCQRATLSTSALFLAHQFDGDMHISPIKKDADYAAAGNNQGTVEMTYGGTPNNLYAFAIRLF